MLTVQMAFWLASRKRANYGFGLASLTQGKHLTEKRPGVH
jgi:hypothetical protein